MIKPRILLLSGILVLNLHALSQIQVTGYIDENTTWTEDSHYQLTGNITIRRNATLTIHKNVQVDMGNHKIYVGSSSAGTLIANEASFTATGNADQEIRFQDGSSGSINQCVLTNVGVVILDDALTAIILTQNQFYEVDYPLTMNPMRIPVFTGNTSNSELIALEGTVDENATLGIMQFGYALSASLTVRGDAILTLASGSHLDFKSSHLNIGSSTPGKLIAENVDFMTSLSNERKINVKDGGEVIMMQCRFNKVSVDIDSDAGENIFDRCSFDNINYPVIADVNRIPTLTDNLSSIPLLAISGVVRENITLEKLAWDYALNSSLSVRDNAILTVLSGVTIHLMSSNISLGVSSSAGHMVADHAFFTSKSSSDKSIKLADGGTANLTFSLFDNVFIDIGEDAGEPVTLTSNFFTHCTWSVRTYPQHPPIMSENKGDNKWVGLRGIVNVDCTLPALEWPYGIAETITIRDNAVLTIEPGAIILLNGKYIYVGSSNSNTGTLMADGARFYDLDKKYGRVFFKPGSGGNISSCFFYNARLHIDGGSPTVENSRFSNCRQAIYLDGTASPVIRNNDFYHNTTAVESIADVQVDLSQNWWAHNSGPVHPGNPDGEGETIVGDVLYTPFLTGPTTGGASCELNPSSQLFTSMVTGEKQGSWFQINNRGDEDLLVTKIETSSSSVSVSSDDRLWILPDSSFIIPFTYVALEPGLIKDTIYLYTNDPEEPIQKFLLEGEGEFENLLLNFYYINVDSFPKVECYFTLTDQAHLPIRELTKELITLSEQNILIPEFELSTRSASSAVNVALVIDRSGSMVGSPIRDAVSAAKDFIGNLDEFDQGCIISFSGREVLNQAFTNDKALLTSALERLKAEGSTAVFDAIDLAIEESKDQTGIRAILVLSDGQDNASQLTAADVINKARQYGINIYTIGLGDDAEPTLTNIAWQTGGQYYYSPTSKELALIYRMISGQLQNLYVVTYTADEEGIFPRKVELSVTLDPLTASAIRFYTIGNGEIDFAGAGDPFKLEAFSLRTNNFFYYYVDDPGNLIPEGYTVSWFQDSEDQTFPCGFKYLGEGLMQVWMDLSNVNKTGNYTFAFPDSVDQSGGWITLKNKPANVDVEVEAQAISQSIDLFAGGSVGVKAIAGGVGAGPSVAAASVSASGHGGMGMTFEQDAAGNEWVSRRLEAGVSVGAEAPSINTGIDVVEAGASAEITVTGTVGQTLLFPSDFDDPDLLIKAKAAYVLETLSLGGMAASPYFGIVFVAIVQALKIANPDVNALYDDLFESWNLGANVEGSVGVEFKLSAGEDSGLPEFTFAEASLSMALGGSLTHYIHTGDLSFDMALALAFNVGLLNLEIGNVDLGNIFDKSYGAEISLGADFNTSDGFRSLNLGYQAYKNSSVTIADGFYGNTMEVCVPKTVIVEGINRTGTLIHDVYNIFEPGGGIPNLPMGVNQLTSSIQEFFSMADDTLLNPEDHIMIEMGEQYSKGINIDIKVGLDGALGVGAGLEFGVSLSYMDEISALESSFLIAHGQLLPLAESDGVSPQDKLFSLSDEMDDLIDGVIDLVADGIANLVALGEFILDYGTDFAYEAFDGACSLAGNAWDSGTAIIRSADPRKWFGLPEPYLDTRLHYGYWSDRVGRENQAWNLKSQNPVESDLYITSFAFDVSIFDIGDQLVEEFEPIRLKLAIHNEMFTQLGFSEEDKALARIYRYVPENLSWIRMDEDFCEDPDSVAVDITRSATYAIGIEIYPEYDVTAPAILDYNPKEGYSVAPNTRIWAKLYEGPMDVGVDLGRTRILLDGVEVYATWDPVNSIIAHQPETPMTPGAHQFRIEAGDFRSNTSSLTVDFTVHPASIEDPVTDKGFSTRIYPNPFSEQLTIEFESTLKTTTEISVYDFRGSRVATLFQGNAGPGINRVSWSRRMDNGQVAAPGLYFIRIRQGNKMEVVKSLIL